MGFNDAHLYTREERRQEQQAEYDRLMAINTMLIAITKRILENRTTDEDIRFVLDNQYRWKMVLCDHFVSSAQLLLDTASAFPSRLQPVLAQVIPLFQLNVFTLDANLVTRDAIHHLLELANDAHQSFTGKNEPVSNFIQQIEKFKLRLNNNFLNQNEVLCLNVIVNDYKKHSYRTIFDISNCVAEILSRSTTLSQLQPAAQNNPSFGELMDQYLQKEYLPWASIMEKKSTTNDEFLEPISQFILERHAGQPCNTEQLFAPKGKVTKVGVDAWLQNVCHYRSKRTIENIGSLITSLQKESRSFWNSFDFKQKLKNAKIEAMTTLKNDLFNHMQPSKAVEKIIKLYPFALYGNFDPRVRNMLGQLNSRAVNEFMKNSNMTKYTSTDEDQKKWPELIEREFNAIITSRERIFNCIKARESIKPLAPGNLNDLMTAFHAMDNGCDQVYRGDDRITMAHQQGTYSSKNMRIGYVFIFEAIAAYIGNELVERTKHKKEQEILSSQQENSDHVGNQISKWNRHIHHTVIAKVAGLVKNTLASKIEELPVVDFMKHIELTYEKNPFLADAEALESDPLEYRQDKEYFVEKFWPDLLKKSQDSFDSLYHSWVRLFIHPAGILHFGLESTNSAHRHGSELYRDSTYHYSQDTSNSHGYYLKHHYFKEDCRNSKTYVWQLLKNRDGSLLDKMCAKTLRYLMTQRLPVCTAKEIMLVITALGYHDLDVSQAWGYDKNPFDGAFRTSRSSRTISDEEYNAIPEDIRPLSGAERAELIAKFPSALHALIIKNNHRYLPNPTNAQIKKKEFEAGKTAVIIDCIHTHISQSPELRTAYCQYLVNHTPEPQQAVFLHKHVRTALGFAENKEQKKNILAACLPIWAKDSKSLPTRHGVSTLSHFISRLLSCINRPGSSKDKWTVLGNGSINMAYKSGDGRSVFKLMHVVEPDEQLMDTPERSVRLWNEMNPSLKPPARVSCEYVEGNLELGWVGPFVPGRQASDLEMKNKAISTFNEVGRIILDLTSEENIKTTPDGTMVCVDVGMAVKLDKIAGTDRYVSFSSQYALNRFNFDLFDLHYHAYPQTIDISKALLFIKLEYPEITNADFLKTLDQDEINLFVSAYEELDIVQEYYKQRENTLQQEELEFQKKMQKKELEIQKAQFKQMYGISDDLFSHVCDALLSYIGKQVETGRTGCGFYKKLTLDDQVFKFDTPNLFCNKGLC